MKSAAQRTIPLFEGEPGPKPKKPTTRTLRTRLWKAALKWYRDECGYEEVLRAARALDKEDNGSNVPSRLQDRSIVAKS